MSILKVDVIYFYDFLIVDSKIEICLKYLSDKNFQKLP